SEYFVAREDIAPALAAVMPLGERIRPLLHASEVRTVAADELWLSPAHRRDSACVHFTWKQRPEEDAALLPAIEERLAPLAQQPRLTHVQPRPERLTRPPVSPNAYVEGLLGLCAPPRRIPPHPTETARPACPPPEPASLPPTRPARRWAGPPGTATAPPSPR